MEDSNDSKLEDCENPPAKKKVKFSSESTFVEPDPSPTTNLKDQDDEADLDYLDDPDSSYLPSEFTNSEEKLTPFNMNEEFEEGNIDSEGNYILGRKQIIRDNWIDNVDWQDVSQQRPKIEDVWGENEAEEKDADVSSSGDNLNEQDDLVSKKAEIVRSKYVELAQYLLDGETALHALCRLGKDGASKTTRPWEKKPKIKNDKVSALPDDKCNTISMEKFLHLTELVDFLLQAGEFDIYQETKEKILFKLKSTSQHLETPGTCEDDTLDAIGDSLDVNCDRSSSKQSKPTVIDPQVLSVQWELRDKSSGEVKGPLTTQEIVELKSKDELDHSHEARRFPDGKFYPLDRIDFELYE